MAQNNLLQSSDLSYEQRFQDAAELAKQMHDEQAIYILTNLIDENPSDYRLYALMGEAALNMREHEAALKNFKFALMLRPKDPFISVRMADSLVNMGQPERAKRILLKVKDKFIGTRDAPLWAQTMGDCLRALGDYENAEKYLKYAIQEVPNWSAPWGSLAILKVCQHEYHEATGYFERQYHLKPTWKSTHELGMHLPFVNRHREAYELWHQAGKWKWHGKQFLGKTMWEGERCDKLMIYGDGGLGDTIQYSRYLMAAKKYAKTVYFCPQKRHAEIVAAMDLPGIEISQTMEWDYATWLMILPGHVRLWEPKDAPAPIQLKFAPTELFHPAIAISWAGDFKHANDKLRSVKLKDFSRLIKAYPKARWFTVSPGNKIAEEIKRSKLPITQYSGTLTEAVQRLCSADAYVGVDTGHAHVVATKGKPTHMIFKEFVDSRWGADKDKTPYYNSMSLYRSYRDGWDTCITRMIEELKWLS